MGLRVRITRGRDVAWHPVLVPRPYGPRWLLGRRMLVRRNFEDQFNGWRLMEYATDLCRLPASAWTHGAAEALFRSGRPFGVAMVGPRRSVSCSAFPNHLYVLGEVIGFPMGLWLEDHEVAPLSGAHQIMWGQPNRWKSIWRLEFVAHVENAFEVRLEDMDMDNVDRTFTDHGRVLRLWRIDQIDGGDLLPLGQTRQMGPFVAYSDRFISWRVGRELWAVMHGFCTGTAHWYVGQLVRQDQ